ncbi:MULTISPECIES: DNA helicase [unclassified Aureimonas]|uniref:DNA helicase n=1 Tax=unclassified Aureimonas TaxID=2615206 RepID=UPI0006F80BF1|nr:MULTISPECIES: DNA helicase [unclassified Aureimonas]KQT69742.1 DNA helicase [Aureimonas sp. Leaf427]KQT76106.1 DNA helicase [Aureimonas sp. Leaf460]
MHLSAPIVRLRAKARQRSRITNIPLHAALDQVAAEEGFERWSLLAAKSSRAHAADAILRRLRPGDMLLLAGRPGEGKTLFGLDLAAQAMLAGRSAAMFSLVYTARDVLARLADLGWQAQRFDALFRFYDSSDISSRYIIETLADASVGTLVVIDYLQLLDQKREHPPLLDQVRQLKDFAIRKGLVLAFLSQIDRSYDPAASPMPSLGDISTPNPLDLSLFDKACFLNGGNVHFEALAPTAV